jgi:hypothetical protein
MQIIEKQAKSVVQFKELIKFSKYRSQLNRKDRVWNPRRMKNDPFYEHMLSKFGKSVLI